MKKHLELQSLSPEQFRRLTGVKQKTFEEMVLILRMEWAIMTLVSADLIDFLRN
jgi:hypothetical protein